MALNVYQKLHEVMKAVAYIKKDTKVQDGGGYMAVGHDNVTAMVRPHFIAQGIVMTVSQTESKMEQTGTVTGKGTPIIRYQGWYEVSFVNSDDPADRVMERVESHANDTGDKAPGKAMSYAAKYAVLKVLMLETGETDESRYDGNGHDEVDPEKSAKLVADWKAAMDAETTREALKETAFKGVAIAVQASDKEAEMALRAYYKTLRDNLPVSPKARAAA
jgi:hypothetical protein